MLMNPFRRREDSFALIVGMIGVKMGDRLVQIGCADGVRLAAIASKVGLSGRAAAVVGDPQIAARVEKAASRAGVLVEVDVAPPTTLPMDAGAFDVVIIDDSAALFSEMTPDERSATVREAARVLRAGGRVMVIGSAPRGGLGAMLSRAPVVTSADPSAALQANGFRAVRVLAERDGLIFFEGLKPRR
jgi:ubiquinone/menaquinone biosynthesis C-methylase UbiE